MSDKKYVDAFHALEDYLCQELGVTLQELNVRIMDWAEKDPLRWKTWEETVRNGDRLEELQVFAKATLKKTVPPPEKPKTDSDDLWS